MSHPLGDVVPSVPSSRTRSPQWYVHRLCAQPPPRFPSWSRRKSGSHPTLIQPSQIRTKGTRNTGTYVPRWSFTRPWFPWSVWLPVCPRRLQISFILALIM
jgi:hypothetical protein